MKHEMRLHPEPFNLIKKGTKTIEMRLYDEKRRQIKEGDLITFTNRETDEKIDTEVLKLYIYPSFEELYKHFDKVSIGYNEDETPNPDDMDIYYKSIIRCKPGITGMWQANGRSDVGFIDRCKLDDYYYRNWTLGLDTIIIYKTIKSVIYGKGAL